MNAADLISATKSRPGGFNARQIARHGKPLCVKSRARACHPASQLSTDIRAITRGKKERKKNKNKNNRPTVHRTAAYRKVAYRKSRTVHLSLARLVEKRSPAVGHRDDIHPPRDEDSSRSQLTLVEILLSIILERTRWIGHLCGQICRFDRVRLVITDRRSNRRILFWWMGLTRVHGVIMCWNDWGNERKWWNNVWCDCNIRTQRVDARVKCQN